MKLRRMSTRDTNIVLVAVCSVVVLGIVGFLIWVNRSNAKLADSQDWPSTAGAVVSTSIRRGSETYGSGYAETEKTVYIPALEYAYHVGSQEYTSENITVDSSWGLERYDTEKEAYAYLDGNYPVGTELLVYYNPENPREAFLFKKQPWLTGAISAFMYGFIALFLGIIVYLLRNLNKPLR